MVRRFVGYSRWRHLLPALFKDMLSLGFQRRVDVHFYSKASQETLVVESGIGFLIRKEGLAQWVHQDEEMVSWLVMYCFAGNFVKKPNAAYVAKVLKSITIGWASGS